MKKNQEGAQVSFTIQDLSKMGANISKILNTIAPARFCRNNLVNASSSNLNFSNMSKTITPKPNNMESLIKEVNTATDKDLRLLSLYVRSQQNLIKSTRLKDAPGGLTDQITRQEVDEEDKMSD